MSPTSLWVSKFDIKFQNLMSISNLQQVGDFSIFGSKSSHVQGVILKIGYFSFFNFRLCTYNVPSGSSATSLKTSAKRQFDGTDGRSTKVSFNFLHNFWEFRACIYKYILKNCHQHSYGFQNLMSSWGWGNNIFEIILCTSVFKYLVPKVVFFSLIGLGVFETPYF